MIKRLIYSFYLMLLSPVFALVIGLKEQNFRFKRALLVVFITLYGSTIVLSDGQDGLVHLGNVYEHYVTLPFAQFFNELISIIRFSPEYGTNDDIYIHLLSYFVGSILGMPQLFFVFVSFIYAYFFAGSIFKVLRILPKTKLSFTFYAFAVIFLLQKNLEGINTVRTWTGLWVLFYAVLSYLETKKLKYLILMFMPPLIHVGYFIMAIPAWFVVFFGRRFMVVYAGIFFVSFFYGINKNTAMESLAQTEVGANKSEGYYVEEGNDNQSEKYDKATWYRKSQKSGLQNYALYLIAFSLIFGGVYFKKMTSLENNLFSIGILTKALSNFSFFIYALASRSNLIGSIFILAAFVIILKRGLFQMDKNWKNIVFNGIFAISIALFFPYIIYKIADLIYFISFFMLALPFIPWIFNDINFSIRKLLDWIF